MTAELPNHAIDAPKAGSSAADSNHLSQVVFANPQDFLTTLQSILPKVNPADPDDVGKSDLINYSTRGDNAQDKAAAAIAANHFDQLRQLPTTIFGDYSIGDKTGLNQVEVGLDRELASGNLQPEIQVRQMQDAVIAIGSGATAAVLGACAGLGVEAPPVALVLGAAAVTAGILGAGTVLDAVTLQSRAASKSTQDRSILASWPELNRGHLDTK
jgi:hypothetical protein